jgi:hypothetical protein
MLEILKNDDGAFEEFGTGKNMQLVQHIHRLILPFCFSPIRHMFEVERIHEAWQILKNTYVTFFWVQSRSDRTSLAAFIPSAIFALVALRRR